MVAPVSADMLIKLALAAAAAGALVYAYKRVSSGLAALPSVSEVVDNVSAVVPYINPASPQNLINQGVNAVGGALAGKPADDWSLGTWLYDVTHPETVDSLTNVPSMSGGYTGSW